jgi:hypothetical protein
MIHTPKPSSIIIRKLKIKTQIIYSFPDPSNQQKKYIKSETLYKKNGLIAEQKEYKQGKIILWDKYTYDKNKRLITKEILSNPIWPKSIKTAYWNITRYNYDESGNLITSNYIPIITVDELNRTVETEYFDNGNLNSITLKEGGKILNIKKFKSNSLYSEIEYSKSGNILQNTTYDYNNNAIKKKVIYEYDISDNLIRETEKNENDEIVYDRVYFYDANNNLTESRDLYRSYYSNLDDEQMQLLIDGKEIEKGYKSIYTYNEQQLLVKHELYMLGKLVMTYKIEYINYDNE